jgi:hypothetical protein
MGESSKRIMTDRAVPYAWLQLAQRAGVPQSELAIDNGRLLDVNIHYGSLEQVTAGENSIVVIPCHSDQWYLLLERNPDTISWIPMEQILPDGVRLPGVDSMPVLFWGAGCEDGRKPFIERHETGAIIFYADILAATLFMLSRWEETVVSTRDQHNRFPATASVAYRQGFLDRPIVDEYALILKAWLRVLMPDWEPQSRRFSIKLSHDIDSVRRASVKALAGDLLKRGNIRQAGETAQALFRPERDHHLRGIYRLADWSEQHGFRGAFYFMTAQSGLHDNGYDFQSPLLQRCITDLRERGHEIGFHPGYHTFNDPQRFVAEKQRMDAVLGQGRYGGRHHYLRFCAPDTWQQWAEAGLVYDSTLSYADHEGFRCGTCHPYQPFDTRQDRQLDLLEIPLIVMDGTLKQYRGLTPEAGKERILLLARRCQQVGGEFTLLWHNNSLLNDWRPWADMYRQVLSELAEMVG